MSERIWKFQVSQWFENELLTEKLPIVFSRLNEIGVGRFNNHIFAFFRLFSADHSFEERLVKFGVTIEFKFVDIVATFLSVLKVSQLEVLESPSFAQKKAFSWTRRRNFSTSCLTKNSSVFLEMGTKFKPLLRTNFSESESGKIFWNGTYSFKALHT